MPTKILAAASTPPPPGSAAPPEESWLVRLWCALLHADAKHLYARHDSAGWVIFWTLSPLFITLPLNILIYGILSGFFPVYVALSVCAVILETTTYVVAARMPPEDLMKKRWFLALLAAEVLVFSGPFTAPLVLEPIDARLMPVNKLAYIGFMIIISLLHGTQVALLWFRKDDPAIANGRWLWNAERTLHVVDAYTDLGLGAALFISMADSGYTLPRIATLICCLIFAGTDTIVTMASIFWPIYLGPHAKRYILIAFACEAGILVTTCVAIRQQVDSGHFNFAGSMYVQTWFYVVSAVFTVVSTIVTLVGMKSIFGTLRTVATRVAPVTLGRTQPGMGNDDWSVFKETAAGRPGGPEAEEKTGCVRITVDA